MNLKILLKDYFSKQINFNEDVALLFSGGTDSLTCLFSLLELNIRPVLYSFHIEGVVHQDIITSKNVADYYSLNHKIITIKKDKKQLIKDVKYLIEEYQIHKKTNVQCTYPFLHTLPNIEENVIVTGLCADDLYGSAKSIAINFKDDKQKFDEKRIKIFSDLTSSAYRPIKDLVEKTYNKKLVAPYRDKNIIDFFMQYSWRELNQPKQKQIAVNAFEDYYNKQNIYRRNDNLQVGSKIREWHDELLTSELNKNNRKRVNEIYKDYYKEVFNATT